MTNESLNDAGHHFNERGGKCQCGRTWKHHWDKDSPVYRQPCPGKRPERERFAIDDDDAF
jgi:hypothetical protein